jgi:hypothetical protein
MAKTNINNDTEELDKKKNTSDTGTKSNDNIKNIWKYLLSVFITILLVVGYFIFSSIILYECKLAQSNIVPTNLECYPYTENYPEIQKIFTNIFITNTEPQNSVKLGFPYDKYNSKNILLDMFRKYKEQPKSNFFINYIIAILEGLINYSNNALVTFFNLLNKMPELLIIILGPILSVIYFSLSPLIGIFIFIYYYFFEMKWFFKENTNTNSNAKPIWNDVNLFETTKYGIAWLIVFIFFILFWILLFTVAPILSIAIFYMCLFMTFGYKGEIDTKKATVFTIIQETFKHYKVTLTTILTVMISLNAFVNLGILPGVFAIVTVMLIYFKFIPINIFEPIKATNLSTLSTFEQAVKKCNYTVKNYPITFFELFDNFFDNKKGGGIGRELKKINRQLNK